jgi:hypothetical protein
MEPSVFNLEAGLCSKVNLGTELQHVEVRKVERSARRCALPSAAGFAEGLNFSHQADVKPVI